MVGQCDSDLMLFLSQQYKHLLLIKTKSTITGFKYLGLNHYMGTNRMGTEQENDHTHVETHKLVYTFREYKLLYKLVSP